MPSLKFRIKDFEFEYIGEHEEMVKFIQELMASPSNVNILPTTSTKSLNPKPIHFERATTSLQVSLPSDEAVLEYIISQPSYEHTLFEIQKHFFHQTFPSRGATLSMYLKMAKQLRHVQGEIERRFKGRFERKRGKLRLNYYVFKKDEGTS